MLLANPRAAATRGVKPVGKVTSAMPGGGTAEIKDNRVLLTLEPTGAETVVLSFAEAAPEPAQEP